jgi:hypothetical protein
MASTQYNSGETCGSLIQALDGKIVSCKFHSFVFLGLCESLRANLCSLVWTLKDLVKLCTLPFPYLLGLNLPLSEHIVTAAHEINHFHMNGNCKFHNHAWLSSSSYLLVTFFLFSWALFSLWHSSEYTDVAWHWVQISMVCEKPCNIYNRGKMQQMSPILNSLDAFATHITYMLSSVHTLQDWGMYTNVSLNIIFIIFSGTCGFKFIYTLWSIISCENCCSMVSRHVQPSHSPFTCNTKIPCDCGIPSLKPKMATLSSGIHVTKMSVGKI